MILNIRKRWEQLLYALYLTDSGGYLTGFGFIIGTIYALFIATPLPLYFLILDFTYDTKPLYTILGFIVWIVILVRPWDED